MSSSWQKTKRLAIASVPLRAGGASANDRSRTVRADGFAGVVGVDGLHEVFRSAVRPVAPDRTARFDRDGTVHGPETRQAADGRGFHTEGTATAARVAGPRGDSPATA